MFKGTEPLLADFSAYLDWTLGVSIRGSHLPMGLHFPLEMKLPPVAMWIEECLLEQEITSKIQIEYLAHYGRIARLPVPLFVYDLTPEQVRQYGALVRTRISAAAFKRIEAKVTEGLGVEVYYYPCLPIRPADLFVRDIKIPLRSALTADALEATFNDWIRLMADLLHLGYMPYAPWNHGMGACVDPGNACIDGGFNDLLTIVPFDSIPNDYLFSRSLVSSMQMLASSIVAVCSVATNTNRSPYVSDPPAAAVAYVTERLRALIGSEQCTGHAGDARLLRFFDAPSVEDIVRHVREAHRDGTPAQFRHPQPPAPTVTELKAVDVGSGLEDSQALGV